MSQRAAPKSNILMYHLHCTIPLTIFNLQNTSPLKILFHTFRVCYFVTMEICGMHKNRDYTMLGNRMKPKALLLILGILTSSHLITHVPDVDEDMRHGEECAQLLLEAYIALEMNDNQTVTRCYTQLKQFTPFATDAHPYFFQGLLNTIKTWDIANILEKISLDKEGYARLLVMYHFLLLYCSRAMNTDNLHSVNVSEILDSSYHQAAKEVYGDVSSEIILSIKESINAFEKMMQSTYALT